MSTRRAGQHARQTTRRKAQLWLLVVAAGVAVGALVVLVGDLSWAATVAVELVVLLGLVLIDRFAAPVVERWGRGAAGEEHVGSVMEELGVDGWLTLHDVDTARGLVFSRAYLVGRPVSRQRGVVVLPARMLAGHLRRRRDLLSAEEAQRLHDRLQRALGRPALAG